MTVPSLKQRLALTVVPDLAGRDSSAPASPIHEIVREGARRMLAEALQAEVDGALEGYAQGWHQSLEAGAERRTAA